MCPERGCGAFEGSSFYDFYKALLKGDKMKSPHGCDVAGSRLALRTPTTVNWMGQSLQLIHGAFCFPGITYSWGPEGARYKTVHLWVRG